MTNNLMRKQWSGLANKKRQDCNPGLEEGRLWSVQGSAWKNPTGDSCGEKRDPGELVGFQRSPSPRSMVVHLTSRKTSRGGRMPS